MKRTKNKRVAVDGKAAVASLDREGYQRLLDFAARADAKEGIRQGLEDARKGGMQPVEEFFKDFEARHGIPS